MVERPKVDITRYLSGAILAGGKSSRMGQEKALLLWEGKPMVMRVAQTLQQVFSEVLVVSDNAETYRFLGLRIVPDIFKGCGPLGGIHSALVHAAAEGVFVCSCDMPCITPALVRKIVHRSSLREVTFASDGMQLHPLLGVYPKTILPSIQVELQTGPKRMFTFLTRVPHTVIDLSEFSDQLRNINSPEDYDQAPII